MRRPILILAALLLALGVVEGVSYWWMHPAPAGLGEPVLVYRPGSSGQGTEDRGQGTGVRGQEPEGGSQETASGVARNPNSTFDVGSSTLDVPPSPSSIQNPKSKIQNSGTSSSSLPNSKSNIQNPTFSTLTPLPDVVASALPSLRCTTGTAARIDRDDDVTIYVAFFEWDRADSRNVLEAFKHLPEQCMGSIGLKLVEFRPARAYKIGNEILSFDHTVFRDPVGRPVQAFKGTWVSGATDLLGAGVRGGAEQWRQIRFKAALKRFHPAHARVVQGAVRGIANPDRAWEIFEESMLHDLAFQR